MKVTARFKDGSVKIHIEDEVDYYCTDDNGVDVYFTKEQIELINTGEVGDKVRK